MLNCPECNTKSLYVKGRTIINDEGLIKRRLECSECGEVFASHEVRAMDLVDSGQIHFNQVVEKLRSNQQKGNIFERQIPQPTLLTTLIKSISCGCLCRRDNKKAA